MYIEHLSWNLGQNDMMVLFNDIHVFKGSNQYIVETISIFSSGSVGNVLRFCRFCVDWWDDPHY